MAALHKLSSPELTVVVSEKGAEVQSVRSKKGLEFMWHAGSEWPRHAPVLFPIVGRLKNDRYRYGGREYSMSQHGFARDMVFTCARSSSEELVFELMADAQTLERYPFQFLLRITYRLSGNELLCEYEVKNEGGWKMLFSVGAHPGFRVPLEAGEVFTDYYVSLEKHTVMQTALSDGLRSDETRIVPLDDKKLRLTPTVFDNDALVFEDNQIDRVVLTNEKGNHAVEMTCEGWPFFGIWSKKGNQEFVCLEPWHGIADAANGDQDLVKKKGIRSLEPGATFRCSYSTSFR